MTESVAMRVTKRKKEKGAEITWRVSKGKRKMKGVMIFGYLLEVDMYCL